MPYFSRFSRSGLSRVPHSWRSRIFSSPLKSARRHRASSQSQYSLSMARNLKRFYGAGHLHFITCSCYGRQPLLGTERRRDLFLEVLEEVRRRYQFVVAGYVVMPEHFHLLISEPQEKTPSTVIQALKLGFARRVIAQAGRLAASVELTSRSAREVGHPLPHTAEHIWLKRFYDFNVWSEEKRVGKLRYMHRNPVKQELVTSPELWRWSSFRAYALGEAGTVKVNQWGVLKMKVRPPAE